MDWEIGIFLNCGTTLGVSLEFQVESASAEVRQERRDSFPEEAEK